MNKLPEHFIWLDFKYTMEIMTMHDPDESHATEEIFCDIRFQYLDENDMNMGEPVAIGYMKLIFYNLEWARKNRINPHTVVESFSSAFSILLDKTSGLLKSTVTTQIGRALNTNILEIEEIVIFPEFRGKELGGEVIKGLAKHFFNKCGYIVLQSYPLQFKPVDIAMRFYMERERLRLDNLPTDIDKAQTRLNNFFISCGFNQFKEELNLFFLHVEKVEFYFNKHGLVRVRRTKDK